MTSLPVLLTTGEVAEVLQVDAATVRRWITSGKLRAVRLPSGQSRIPREVIEGILNGQHAERSA